ncbi:phosphotransferase [Demequina sp.]|uniref:phosphotransferase n=1 Tax=Demequina sp. TaxID=2050685 RepID=UPI003D0E8EC3
MSNLPDAHPAVSAETARALVDSQFPQFAELPLGDMTFGWDNAMVRLGDSLAVRMPRIPESVGSLLKERDLLHRLGEAWTFPFPRIVGDGSPGHGYPWPWSIITWLPGSIAAERPLSADGAGDLGRALAQVHVPADPNAPLNSEQSVEMEARNDVTVSAMEAAAVTGGPRGEQLDLGLARSVWERALGAPGPQEQVWAHADLHAFNALTRDDGALAGIIDWGDMAACDPAVDLGFACMLTSAEGLEAMFDAYSETHPVDAALRARAHGIGLQKAARLAAWHEELTRATGWRGLASLGLVRNR